MKIMKTNTKLVLVFIVGVILPALLVFMNGYLADQDKKSWNYFYEAPVFKGLLILAILSCAAIVVINYKGQKVSFWYTLSIASAIALGLLLYVGLSVSNFGF